jgi:hypothetical protein
MDQSTVRLRALSGAPLADDAVRTTVVATAHAIAERTGVALLAIEAAADSVTVTLGTDKLAAMGFLAELRRLTNTWFARKRSGESLWGEVPRDEGDGEPEI